MIIVKITILLWVLYFVLRFFARSTMDYKTALAYTLNLNKKIRLIDWLLVIDLMLSILGTIASIVWLLFFRL